MNYFRADPTLANEYDEVCRWADWRYNGGKADTGIDLVAHRVEDDTWTAIQCKFYLETTTIQKSNLDSFFEASGRSFETENGTENFANRLIISTTDRWSSNAEAALENQIIPTNRIGLASIAESPIDWDVAFPGSEMQIHLTKRETFEPRPHQQAAIENAIKGFETHERGQLIMACGTGKTFTGLRLAERVANNNGGRARVLFLVPSISLLSQTLKEWTAQAQLDLRSYAVCSDNKVSKKAEDIASYDLEVPVSTEGKSIAERFSRGKRFKGLHVVFSTYQSLPAVHDAQQEGLEDFDLVICDEAHRTTGVTLFGEDPSNFTHIHDANYIKATKRLYMTATPRLYDENAKGKAAEHSAEVMSMDDEGTFGPEFHRLGFGEAVEKGLLTDYKVLVMTVDEEVAAEALSRGGGNEVNLSLASAMIGAWNGLAKRSGKEQGTKSGFSVDAAPMRRTVAFAKDIKTSKAIADSYPYLIDSYRESLKEHAALNDIDLHNVDLEVAVQHVDGGMNAMERNTKISWLESTLSNEETRILTNARCLSEGVDVPALDSVVFFNPRNSMVDVVQSVGRVMRKSEGKDYGYIILPVAVPPNTSPSAALNDNTRFKVVWQILNALRAHDDRFNAKINSIALNEGNVEQLPIEVDHTDDPHKKLTDAENAKSDAYGDGSEMTQKIALFSLEQWQEAMYTKLVDKVGTRTYWEDWADDVATIAQAQITRIRALVDAADSDLRSEFEAFVEGLRGNLNDSITEDEAISMLSQHLITAPVFNALFTEYDFTKHNPVAQVMQRMTDALSDANLEKETESLDKFYESVRTRASEVNTASGKQEVIKELYERFFQNAFKKQAESLGIVYTPVEIVDFILRAADDLSKKHFGKGLTDEGTYILDPFAGTSTFTVRLLQSGLIKPEDLARKYANELFATEIMLLAYYVSTVNIETTYNALKAEEAKRNGEPEPEYVPFNGIALADTFQIHEDGDILDLKVFANNNERIERQKQAPINIVVGNPPWFVGQEDASDFQQKVEYPTLDKQIHDSFVRLSNARSNRTAYDSYFRAFRWAFTRIGARGIVAFVTNNGWIDGNSADGFRKTVEKEFDELYIYNLRGNMNDAATKYTDGGNLFNVLIGNAIFVGIRKVNPSTECKIFYYEFPDSLDTEAKKDILSASNIHNTKWKLLTSNEFGDWKNHRSTEFTSATPIGLKDETGRPSIFNSYSGGFNSGKDAWLYNFNQAKLDKNVCALIRMITSIKKHATSPGVSPETIIKSFQAKEEKYSTISWSRNLINAVKSKKQLVVSGDKFFVSQYRPFCKQFSYIDSTVGEMTYRLPYQFPTPTHRNLGFSVTGTSSHHLFSAMASNNPTNYHLLDTSQYFPRFTWQQVDGEVEGALFGEGIGKQVAGESSIYGEIGEYVDGYVRVDNVTDEIKKLYRDALGSGICGDDIFHFVYGKLHDPAYRSTYAADLKKMLPHIETPATREEFDKFAIAGKQLMDLHVNYEDVKPWPVTITVKGDDSDRETWRVTKLKWAKVKDPETGKNVNDVTKMIYNNKVTISDIPAEADNYMLGSRSALAWIIDRYQMKKDKASGIVNDPNDWADEVGNPRYIADLIAKVTRVAVETVQIVNALEG